MRLLSTFALVVIVLIMSGCATAAVQNIGVTRDYLDAPTDAVIGTDGSVAIHTATQGSTGRLWAIYNRATMEKIVGDQKPSTSTRPTLVTLHFETDPGVRYVDVTSSGDSAVLPAELRLGAVTRWSKCDPRLQYRLGDRVYSLDFENSRERETSTALGNVIRPILLVPAYLIDLVPLPIYFVVLHDVH